MASLVKKKKGNRLYYYLVESARVDGQPRIVHQAYLGTAEKLAELVQQKTAPVPVSATLRDFGLPGALWLAAKHSGVWPLLESLWPSHVLDKFAKRRIAFHRSKNLHFRRIEPFVKRRALIQQCFGFLVVVEVSVVVCE
jgi:hypothetical protein